MHANRILVVMVVTLTVCSWPASSWPAEPFTTCAQLAEGRAVVHFVSFEKTYPLQTYFLCVAVESQGYCTSGPGIVAVIDSDGKTYWKHEISGWIGEVSAVSAHSLTGPRYNFDKQQALEKQMQGWPFIKVREEGLGSKEFGFWIMCPWDRTVYHGEVSCEGTKHVSKPKLSEKIPRLLREAILWFWSGHFC